MEHHFNIDLAKKLGIEEAIFLHNLYFWLQNNATKNINFFDGSYWTYNTKQAYTEIFPYISYDKIKRMISDLRENGIIKTGHYDQNKMNRTLWYAFTDCGLAMMKEAGYKVSVFGFEPDDEDGDKNCVDGKVQDEISQEGKIPQCTTNINKTDNNNKDKEEKNKDKSLSKKAQEGFIFPDDKEAKFLEWCNTHIPNVMRNKKPLSYAEYIQLQCDGFIPQKILDKLLYINAIAGFNRKYHDVYGVLKNWLNGDNDPNYYQKFKNKKKTDKAA